MKFNLSDDGKSIVATINGHSVTLDAAQALACLAQGYTCLRSLPSVPIAQSQWTPDPNKMFVGQSWELRLPDSSQSRNPSQDGAVLLVRAEPVGWIAMPLDSKDCQQAASWFAGDHEALRANRSDATKH